MPLKANQQAGPVFFRGRPRVFPWRERFVRNLRLGEGIQVRAAWVRRSECAFEALLHDPGEFRAVFRSMDPRAVGDVFEEGFRERVGFLEHHSNPLAQGDDVRAVLIDFSPVNRSLRSQT